MFCGEMVALAYRMRRISKALLKEQPAAPVVVMWRKVLGDRSGGGTPGLIPNPAVKPASADGT